MPLTIHHKIRRRGHGVPELRPVPARPCSKPDDMPEVTTFPPPSVEERAPAVGESGLSGKGQQCIPRSKAGGLKEEVVAAGCLRFFSCSLGRLCLDFWNQSKVFES